MKEAQQQSFVTKLKLEHEKSKQSLDSERQTLLKQITDSEKTHQKQQQQIQTLKEALADLEEDVLAKISACIS